MKHRILAAAGLILLSCGNLRAAIFHDRFEANTLDPYWSTTTSNGSISLVSTRAHSGTKSLQLNTTNASATKSVQVSHDFPTPVFGKVSVWAYDSFADDLSGNYIFLRTGNAALDRFANLYTQDYDLGPTNGGNYYVESHPTVNKATNVDRTKNWHLFEIESRPDSLKMMVDSIVVHSEPAGFPFANVALTLHAPGFRPGVSMQFDDFQFISIPEPRCIALLSMGVIGWFSGGHRMHRPVTRK
jgi:hypothetical protein